MVLASLAAGFLASAAISCNQGPQKPSGSKGDGMSEAEVMKVLGPPAAPPEPPPRMDMPLSSELRGRAKAVLFETARANRPMLRRDALEALSRSVGVEAKAEYINALSDADPAVRFTGAMACGSLRIAESRSKLLHLVNDPDRRVQIAARFGLHRIGDYTYSRDFEKTARDLDPAVRAVTAQVLGLLEEPTAVNILASMTSDRNQYVRLCVAEAMWRMGDEEALQPLLAGMISPDPADQMMCITAVAAPGRRDVIQHVRSRLTHPTWVEIPLVAARAMGDLGSDEGMTIAVRAVSSAEPRHRAMAAMALRSIGRTDAQPMLANLLQDPVPQVRLSAALAVLQLKAPSTAGGVGR
jgi:HEAT repeat protein